MINVSGRADVTPVASGGVTIEIAAVLVGSIGIGVDVSLTTGRPVIAEAGSG